LVAGLILATLLNVTAVPESPGEAPMTMRLTAAGLALLGGFSSNVIYRLLQRLVGSVEAVLAGDQRARMDALDALAGARADRRIEEQRLALLRGLTALRGAASAEGAPAITEQIDALITLTTRGEDAAADDP